MKLLFVCTGNTCRSPMAAVIAGSMAASLGLPLEARSAGVAAWPGQEMTPAAVQALKDEGWWDEGVHESTPVTPELMEWADLVLTMTRAHKEQLALQYPHFADKVETLKGYARARGASGEADGEMDEDVLDPYGQGREVYRSCAVELAREIEQVLRAILERDAEGS